MNTTHKNFHALYIICLKNRLLYAIVLLLVAQLGKAQLPVPPDCPPVCVPITIKRIPPGSSNNPILPLPVPLFNLQNGNVPYASSVQISAVSVPAAAVIEYSTNGGTTWADGQELSIFTETTVLARTRLNDRVSEVATGQFAPFFRRVFILGNSITAIGQVPEIGWTGNWGMAASAADKDYFHLFSTQLRNRNAAVEVKHIAGSSFERTWWTYDMPGSLDEHLQFGPNGEGADLIIVRIGENIDDSLVESQDLEGYYRRLLDHLKKFSTGAVKVVCTTTFYTGQDKANAVIKKVAAEKGFPVADLHTLSGDASLRASQYANPGLALHPNDAGMQRIAELIWEQVK